jgi:heme/copper-type cytochrome/quinol oxidase subunit 3
VDVLFSPEERFTPGVCVHALSAAAVVIILVAMGMSVVGGICALQRKNWGWAIAGAAAACVFGIWFLGIPALILTAISRDEFSQPLALSHNA